MKVAIVGAGSWGTALGKLLAEKGYQVWLLARRRELARAIDEERVNPEYLPGIKLPDNLRASVDPPEVFREARLVLWVIPCQSLREVARDLQRYLPADVPMISAIKGLEVETGCTPVEILKETLKTVKIFMVLSGPSFALEVARGLPTAVVLAGEEESSVCKVQERLSAPYFRVYRSHDVRGVELCGALKNVIAIAAGISDGLGLGLNARAALITRGLSEIIRLGLKWGAHPLTFSGLAGLGDLVLTCTGKLSRNYTVGVRLGQGEKLPQILTSLHQVAEGVKTAEAVKCLAEDLGVEMPISEAVYRILYEGEDPAEALKKLLARPLKAEFETFPL